MLVCSMVPNAFAPTLVHREPVMLNSAHMAVLEITLSKCVEGSDTSTCFILMHTKQQWRNGAVETQNRTYITKNGMRTWIIVAWEVRRYHKEHNYMTLIFFFGLFLNATVTPPPTKRTKITGAATTSTSGETSKPSQGIDTNLPTALNGEHDK